MNTRSPPLALAAPHLAQEVPLERAAVFAAIISQASDAIALLDAETGRFVEFNTAAHRNLGYSREAFSRLTIADIEAVMDADTVRACMAETRRLGAQEFESRHRHRNGTIRDVRISTRLIRINDADFFAALWNDITATKQAEQRLRDSEERFRRFLQQMPVPLAHVNAQEELIFLNERFNQAFGYTQADVPNLAAWWCSAYPDATYRRGVMATWEAAKQAAMALNTDIQSHEYRITCKNGEQRNVEVSGITLGHEFLALFIDVTDRRRDQTLLEFGNRMLQRVARGAPLDETLEHIALGLEAQYPAMLCSILLLDDEGEHLHHGAAPSLPAGYCAAIDGIRIGPEVGSCGSAAYSGEPVFVSDIASDPRWADFRALALGYDLQACWSTPILSAAGRVLGTFAVYYRHPRVATDVERQAISHVTQLVGLAIERERNNAQLSAQLDELRRWHSAMMGRESRIMELKREVNALLAQAGQPVRYASVEDNNTESAVE